MDNYEYACKLRYDYKLREQYKQELTDLMRKFKAWAEENGVKPNRLGLFRRYWVFPVANAGYDGPHFLRINTAGKVYIPSKWFRYPTEAPMFEQINASIWRIVNRRMREIGPKAAWPS